jgi:hypothetical protein
MAAPLNNTNTGVQQAVFNLDALCEELEKRCVGLRSSLAHAEVEQASASKALTGKF